MKIKIKYTERGFKVGTWTDTYGMKCSIQESSNCDPRLWLGCDEGQHYDENTMPIPGPKCLARMHLDPAQAKALIPLLQHFVDTTYLPAPEEPKPRKKKEPKISVG